MAYANLNWHSPFPAQKMLQLLRRHDVDEDAFHNPGGNFMYGTMLPPNVPSNLMEDEYHRFPVKQRLADARHAEFVVDFGPFLSWLPELRQDPCNLLQTSRGPGMFSLIHTMVNHLPFFDDSVQHNRHMSIDNHPWFQPLCKYIASDPEGIVHLRTGQSVLLALATAEDSRPSRWLSIQAGTRLDIKVPTHVFKSLFSCGLPRY